MRVLPEPRLEGNYRIGGGRRIGFAEYGRADGRLVFWFHGTPGGRRQIAPSARVAAQEMGIRLVVLERPGIGESTPYMYPNIAAWGDDVVSIADRLGARRFAVAGLSGGGPYALACAARAPERVVAGAVLGGVAPTRGEDRAKGGLVALAERFAPMLEFSRGAIGRSLYIASRPLLPFRSQFLDLYMKTSPEGDRIMFRRPEIRAMFLDDFVRMSRRQVHAPVLDVVLFTRDWGFRLADVRVPIRIWHGDSDHIVPLTHAEHMCARLPDAELRVRPGESHLGALDAGEEIFAALLDLWPDDEAGAPDETAVAAGGA